MLGKLLWHEWKRTWKMECLFLAVLFAFSLLGTILCLAPMMDILDKSVNQGIYFEWSDSPLQAFALFTLLSGICVCVMMTAVVLCANLIYQGIHFAKTMYGEEGYLTHTLPVTAHQLLISKILVSGLWILIVQLAAYLSMFVAAVVFVASIHEADAAALWIREGLKGMVRFGYLGWIVHFLASYGAALLMGPFLFMAILVGAITIGQLAKKYKMLVGIVAYGGISFGILIMEVVSQSISSMMLWGMNSTGTVDFHLNLFFGVDMALLINLLAAVLLYFLSHYIIEKKLNLN